MRRAAAAAAAALLIAAGCSGGGAGGDGLGAGESEVLGPADEGVEGAMAIRVGPNDHTESIVDYELRPPAGGAHNPVWWNCGTYDEPVPDEHAVHDLEHGGVWLAYAEGLDDTDLEAIRDLARGNDRVLVSPYPGLPTDEAVVATAWARQLRLDSVDVERLRAFIDRYTDGAQAPEAGVTCVDSPLGRPIP